MRLKEFYYQMEDVDGIGLSDKGDRYPVHKHFYIDVYDNLLSQFKDEPIQLMELGIASGASLLMWSQYFTKGSITGLDIVDPPRIDYLKTLPNVNIIKGDAYTIENSSGIISQLPKQDIFIEDGAHDIDNQIKALTQYHSIVKPGGFYICEDMYLPNLCTYLADGVYKLERNYAVSIFDHHSKVGGLVDDVMIIIQFEN